MASANKKFLLNLTSTRSYFKKRFTGSQESLNVDGSRRPSQLNASPMLLSAGGGFRPCLLPDNSNLLRSSSATDVMAETEAEAQNEVDDLPALTQNIRQLIQALSILKNTISSMSDLSKDAVQSEAHEKLEIVLNVMKMTLNRFPSLRSADILNAVQTLIKKVDGCEFDGSSHCKDEIYDVIDSLALVISNSVSDCLTVGTNCENISNLPKTKSLTCLTPAANGTNSKQSEQTKDEGRRNHEQDVLGGDVLDDSILYKLESGVEIALLRAQTWSKYTKELVSYVERRINLWGDFSRSLLKLAKSVEQSISEDTFLPLQSLFCTALTQDIELASMSQAARTLILNQTFVTTLNQRRTEHDKVRKNLKYVWTKQVRKLHDSIANLRKAKESYISRQQDYKKIRELALKAENESMSLSATGGVNAAKADAKVEKKKKQEDEAMQKAIEAETFYKQCVRDANEQQKQLEQVKCQVLHATKELLVRSDAVLKETTSGYFKLMNTIMETIPHQFQTLHYSSELYEEGSHYLEYVNQLQASEYALAQVHTFVFEPYAINVKSSDPNDTQNDSVHSHQELSKTHSSGLSKGEDSDSMSGGSSMSLESSPTTSPYQHNRRKIITSSSMAELMAQAGDDDHTKHDDETPATFRGVRLSLDAQSHSLRKLRAPSKCAHCDNIIYMQGAECEKCGIASHKKCLEILRLSCTDQHDSARAGVVGLPLDPAIQEVPFIVTKCIQEIDRRGLNIKGIYRISGVKSRVEQVCQSFEVEEGNIDLSDQPPNVIANVLKLYLRQLPEPLLTFRLYLDFVQLAKDEVHGSGLGQILSSLSQLIEQLPPAHHKTCNILMYHLNRVAKNHEVNQMSATNLGIVFGPTLLKPKDGAASLNYLIETPYQTRIIELLIQNVQAIFGPDEGTTVEDSGDIRRKKSPLKSENSSEFTSPGYASWYAPDTLDLLEELAKEEPHFLSLHSLSSDLPVIAAAHHTEETNESRETEDKSKASNEKVFFT